MISLRWKYTGSIWPGMNIQTPPQHLAYEAIKMGYVYRSDALFPQGKADVEKVT